MGLDLPLRTDTAFLYKWNRDGLGASEYAEVADDAGNGNDLDVVTNPAGETGPTVLGGRRHALGQLHGDYARDFSWAFNPRSGYASDAHMSGDSAASVAVAQTDECTLMGWAYLEKYGADGASKGVFITLAGDQSPDSTAANNTQVSCKHGTTGGFEIFFEYGAGVNVSIVPGGTAPLNEWFHWAVVKNSTGPSWKYEVFLNGASQGDDSTSDEPDGGGNAGWVMGAEFSSIVSNNLCGRQQDVAFFDTDLTSSQVAAFAVKASDFLTVATAHGLAGNVEALWANGAEEPDGIDEGPGGHHVREGGSSVETKFVDSIVLDPDGGAVAFDGTTIADQVEGQPSKRLRDLIAATDWTFACWLQPSTRALNGQHALVQYGGLGSGEVNNVLLQVNLNNDWRLHVRHESGASVNRSFTTTDPLAAGDDQYGRCMIAVRKSVEGSGVKYEVFFDGQPVEDSPELVNCTGSLIDDNTQTFMVLGSAQAGVEGGLGTFGSMALYQSGLTDQEILDLYARGETGLPPPTVSNVSPGSGSEIDKNQAITFDVEDESEVTLGLVWMKYAKDRRTYLVYDGSAFRAPFDTYSTVDDVNGDGTKYSFSVRPLGGWEGEVGELTVRATDGNLDVI